MNQASKGQQPVKITQRGDQGSYKIHSLSALSEITTSLSTESDLEALLERFLSTMIRLAGASAGAVRVLTDDGAHMRLVGALGLPPEVLERERIVDLNCGICGEAMRDNRIGMDPVSQICAEHSSTEYFGNGCRRVIAVPMQFKGKVLGVYNLFMPQGKNVPDDVALLFRSISEHLGMALENTRLTRENLRITLMNERQMMANEVHDSLAQTLAYMKMRLALLQGALEKDDEAMSVKYVGDLSQALDGAYSSLRDLLAHFRNRMDPLGLVHALQEIVRGFHDKTGIELEFINQAPDLNLTVDQEVQVFRIVQEALANVNKHSKAQHAQLTIDRQDDQCVVTVTDDGGGLVERADSTKDMHFGLNIMRERAQSLRGSIDIQRLPERGTRVRLSFPAAFGRKENAA
jgi:two-component system, NarL family, nitrate/nitrite sensor histidine kinase NarX